MPEELLPRPAKGTGIPTATWLDPGGGKYVHYYPPNSNSAACGRWRSVPFTREAWLRREKVNKPKCPLCQRKTELAWFVN